MFWGCRGIFGVGSNHSSMIMLWGHDHRVLSPQTPPSHFHLIDDKNLAYHTVVEKLCEIDDDKREIDIYHVHKDWNNVIARIFRVGGGNFLLFILLSLQGKENIWLETATSKNKRKIYNEFFFSYCKKS